MGKFLGKGSFGTVYEISIRNWSKDDKFAIKIIDKHLCDDERGKVPSIIRNEIIVHSKLEHFSILKLFHFFEDKRFVYLVMELCKEGELLTFLKNNRYSISMSEICTLFRQIVLGVQYLHLNKILHRDLKLTNILLNERKSPKISDYGLSTGLREIIRGKICGTPNFLAPEVLRDRIFSEKSDIWSLGCILYQMITGKLPFSGNTIEEVINKIKVVSFQLDDIFDPLARNLIRKMLIKNPEKRISISQVLEHPFLNLGFKYVNKINTFGLKPCSLTTRHGSFQILDNGDVFVEILKGSRIATIDGNGDCIFIQSPEKAQYSYPLSNKKLGTIYEYAKSLIGMIRRKYGIINFIGEDFEAFLLKGQKYEFCISFFGCLNVAKNKHSEEFLFFDNRQTRSYKESLERKVCHDANIYLKKAKEIYLTLCSAIDSSWQFIMKNNCLPLLLYERVRVREHYVEKFINDLEACQKIYIKGVGWCLFSKNKEFVLIFDDESTIFIDVECNKIGYLPNKPQSNINWFSLDKPLPERTKEKLKYLPIFVNGIKFEN